ncbi:MFS transporter [Microbacterium sp. 2P01SA-2]|uniref:MFS transporter n=1 Tax=unclassified Microbacterium TaxID=2609290 RepID=UPI00399F600D
MKRSFSFGRWALVAAGVALIAATYGLVRLAFGLHLPDMSADLGVDTATAGLVSAAGSIVYAIAAVVGFFAAERHPRVLVVTATLTAGGGAVGIAAATDVATFGPAAAIASAGAGLASPALVRLVASTFTDDKSRTPQAIVNAGTGPGLVVAGMIAVILSPDWRLCWLIAAVATVIAGGAVLISDRPRAGGPHNSRPRNSAPADSHESRPLLLPRRGWWAAHRPAIAASVLVGIGASAIWTYGRTVLVDAGGSQTQSVLAWILLGCGGAAVIATSRPLAHLQPRTLWWIGAGLVAVSTLALGAAPTQTTLALGACTVFGWAYVTASGALIGWTTQIDAAHAAAGTALLFVTFMIGQAIGAAALGALLPLGGAATVFAAAAAMAVVGAASLTATESRRQVVEPRP